MAVETGFVRLAAVVFLPPAGKGDEHQALALGPLAQAAANFVAIQLRQADVEQHDFRLQVQGRFEGSLAIVGRVRFVAAILSSMPSEMAASRLSSTIRMRRRLAGRDGAAGSG